MKEEALKLADEFGDRVAWSHTDAVHWCISASAMIRRLVEELDKLNGCLIAEQEHNEMLQTKPLSDDEIYELYASPVTSDRETVQFARAIEERHGIK